MQNWKDIPLTLPVLENGVNSIGDLWNCTSSTPVGLNLLGNKFTNLDEVEFNGDKSHDKVEFFHAEDTASYQKKLGIGAEVSLELLAGLIKITGGLNFEIEDSKGFGREEIFWKWDRITKSATLSPDKLKEHIDEHVKALLLGTDEDDPPPAHLEATHVVTGIDLGANATGSLLITQANTSSKYTVGLMIKGELNLVVASAALTASAEVSEEVKTSNYNKEISLYSVPPLPPPTEPNEFLDLQQKFIEAFKSENHFLDDEDKPILGIPRGFILTPLSQILKPPEGTQLYKSIFESDTQEDLINTLEKLRDFKAKECIRKMILETRPHAYKLLTDKSHVLTDEVEQKEKKVIEEANFFYNELVNAYVQFKTGKDEAEAEKKIKDIIAQFEQCDLMKLELINTFVEDWIERANEELLAVKIDIDEEESSGEFEKDDIEEESKFPNPIEEKRPLKLFTNKSEFVTWLETEKFLKVYYKTASHVKSNGIQKRLYEMSIEMGKLNVATGILYPSVELGKNSEETLMFDLGDEAGLIIFDDVLKMKFFTTVLEASTGLARNGTSRLFSVYAELLGITLPLGSKPENLYTLYEFLSSELDGVDICDSHELTISKLNELSHEYLCIFFNLDGINTITDIVNSLPYLKGLKESSTKIKWIVGTLELGEEYDDSPILFVCHKNLIKAICLDHMDLLILINELELDENQTEFPILSKDKIRENPLSERRLKHAEKVIQVIEGTRELDRGDAPSNHFHQKLSPLVAPLEIASNENNDIRNALTLTTSLLRNQSQLAINFTSAILRIIQPEKISEFDGNELKIDLSNSEKWTKFKQEIQQIIYERSPDLPLINEIKQTLTSFLEEVKVGEIAPHSKINLTDEEDAPTDVDIVNGTIKKLIEITLTLPQNEQLRSWYDELLVIMNTDFTIKVKCIRALTYLNLIEETIKIQDHDIGFYLFFVLLDIAQQIGENQSIKPVTVANALAHCLKRLPWDQDQLSLSARISSCFNEKHYYRLARNLSSCLENKNFLKFHQCIRKFTSMEDWLGIINLMETMSNEKFSEQELTLIWKNPKFLYIMESSKNNLNVLATIQSLFCGNGIPSYLPEFIKEVLRGMTEKTFTWNQNWTNFDEFLRCLQVLYVRQVVPEQFSEVLLSNILSNPDIYEQLKLSNGLLFWNKESEYFEEPWDLPVFLKTIQNILLNPSKTTSKFIKYPVPTPSIPQKFLNQRKSVLRLNTQLYYKLKGIHDENTYQPATMMDILVQTLEMIKRKLSFQEVAKHFHSNRIDILSVLLSNTPDLSLVREIIRNYIQNEAGFAIPLLFQNTNERSKYYCVASLLKELSLNFGNFFSPFTPPYHLITAIRVSNHFHGKSTMLNQFLMTNKSSFYSKNFQENTMIPTYLKGCVEIISLTEETCEPNFWRETVQRGIKQFPVPPKTILLANLHGDALQQQSEEILKILAQISSSFLIFWMPQSFGELHKNKERLGQIIGNLKTSYDLCIDPTDKKLLENAPEEMIISQPFMDSKNYTKMYTAFLRALRPNSSPFVNTKLSELMLKDVENLEIENTSEVSAFLEFIKAKKLRNIKSSLVLQEKEFWTVEEFDVIWNNSPDYVNTFKLLLKVISTDSSCWAQVSESLSILSSEISDPFYKKLKHLHSKCRVETDPIQVKNIQSQIRMIHRDIRRNSLSLKDLFNEMGKIYSLRPELLTLERKSFPQFISDLIDQSAVVTIPMSTSQYFSESWIRETLQTFSEEYQGLRIFVLSVLGTEEDLESRFELLNNLFGRPVIILQEMLLQEGISIRLIKLSDELQRKLHFDAILLIQTEPVVQLHLSHPKEIELHQKFLALIIGVSNLTIITSALVPDFEHIAKNLGFALLSLLRTSQDFVRPEILFVNFSSENDIDNFRTQFEKLGSIAAQFPFESSIQVQFSEICSKIARSLEENSISFDITDESSPQYSSDISELMSRILQTSELQTDYHITMDSWVSLLQTTWKTLANDKYSFGFESLDSLEKIIRKTQAMEAIFSNIDLAMSLHFGINIFYDQFITALNDYKNDTNYATLESTKNQIVTNINSDILSIYESCKKGDNETSCTYCQEILSQVDEFETNFPEFISESKSSLKMYILNHKNVSIRMVQQKLISLELSMDNDTFRKSTQLTDIQNRSLGVKVIPGIRQIVAEVKSLYENLVGFDMLQFIKKADISLIDTVQAFDDDFGNTMFPLEDQFLDWNTRIKLLNQLLNLPKTLFAKRKCEIYQPGMIRSLRDEIQKLLQEIQSNNESKRLRLNFNYTVHAFGIGLFYNYVELREEDWNRFPENNPFCIVPHMERRGRRSY